MASSPIEINMLLNTRGVVEGARDAERSLNVLSDELDDLLAGHDSNDLERGLERAERAADDLEESVSDAGRAVTDLDRTDLSSAEGEARDLEEQMREVQDATERAGDEGKAAGRKLRDGLDNASEGAQELKEEASQSAREAAASFSGDPVDALDFLQETAANALGGFGPMGAAAGIALAVGIGAGVAALETTAEKINENKEQAAQLAIELAGATNAERVASLRDRWNELASSIRDSREWWEVWQSDAVTAIEQIAGAARVNGGVVAQFVDAFDVTDPAERLAALRGAYEQVGAEIAELRQKSDVLRTSGGILTEAERDQILALNDKAGALEKLSPIVQEQIEAAEQEIAVNQALAEAEGLTVEQYEERERVLGEVTEAQEAYSAALEGTADPTAVYDRLLQQQQDKIRETAQAVADATEDSTDSWEDYATDAEVTTQQLIDEWNRQADQAAAFEENLAIIAAAGGEALARELAAKGPEVAGAVAEVIAKSSPEEQQAAIEAHGRATGGEVVNELSTGIDDNADKVKQSVDSAIRRIGSPTITARVTVDDTAVRNYNPPGKTVYVRALVRGGGKILNAAV